MIVKPTTPTYRDCKASLNPKFITRNPYRLANALTALCWAVCGLVLLAAAANWPDYYSPGGAMALCCFSMGMFWQAAEWMDRGR